MVAMLDQRPRGGVALRITAATTSVAALVGALWSQDPVWIGTCAFLAAGAAICLTVLEGCGHADP